MPIEDSNRFKQLGAQDQRFLSQVQSMTSGQMVQGIYREANRGFVGEMIQRAFNGGSDPAPQFHAQLQKLQSLLDRVGEGQGNQLTTQELEDLATQAENFACAKRGMFGTMAPEGVDCDERLK